MLSRTGSAGGLDNNEKYNKKKKKKKREKEMFKERRKRHYCRKPAVLADATKEKKCVEKIASGVLVKVLGSG